MRHHDAGGPPFSEPDQRIVALVAQGPTTPILTRFAKAVHIRLQHTRGQPQCLNHGTVVVHHLGDDRFHIGRLRQGLPHHFEGVGGLAHCTHHHSLPQTGIVSHRQLLQDGRQIADPGGIADRGAAKFVDRPALCHPWANCVNAGPCKRPFSHSLLTSAPSFS